MNKGPRSKKSIKKPAVTIKKPAITVASFHEAKTAELRDLFQSKVIGPRDLKAFVDNYAQEFEQTFPREYPNTAQRIFLFQNASERFLQLHKEKLRNYENNGKKSLVDLVPLLDEFISNFPEGEKAFIYYQDNAIFKEFSESLQSALESKIGDGDRFNLTAGKPGVPSRCVEALLLQSLSKLPLAISTPVQPRKPNDNTPPRTNALGKSIAKLIRRSTNYFNNGNIKGATTVTMTANALSYFDIDAFSKYESEAHPVLHLLPTKQNADIDNFIRACLDSIQPTTSSESLIRFMHTVCLLSPQENRTKHLNSAAAQGYLKTIATDINLDRIMTRSFASQLFILKNIYSDVFPPLLADKIAPYIEEFRAQAHDSRFERDVGRDIIAAANELAVTYPGLINPQYLDFDNPISTELGMESDIAYVDGDLKVCIQIDGDKYHRHLGSKVETQRTKLRDFCFQNQGWELIKFSDSAKSQALVLEQLLQKIVIPTFELKTKNTIKKMTTVISELQMLATEAPLQSKKAKLIEELTLAVKQAKELIPTGAQLKQANTDVEVYSAKNLALANELELQTAKVTEHHANVFAASEEYALLVAEMDILEKQIADRREKYDIASAALKKYDPQKNTDKTITRRGLETAARDAKNDVDELQTSYYSLEDKHKAARAIKAKYEAIYGTAQELLSQLKQTFAQNAQRVAEAQDKIQHIQKALLSPIVGSDLLEAYALFQREVAGSKVTKSKMSADADMFVPDMDFTAPSYHDYVDAPAYQPGMLQTLTAATYAAPSCSYENDYGHLAAGRGVHFAYSHPHAASSLMTNAREENSQPPSHNVRGCYSRTSGH